MKPAIPGKWQFSTTPGTSSTPSPSTPRNRWCYGWKQRLCFHLLPLPILINIALSSQSLSSLPPVRLCPQLLQVPLGCAGVQPQVRELDQQSVQRGVQVRIETHHIWNNAMLGQQDRHWQPRHRGAGGLPADRGLGGGQHQVQVFGTYELYNNYVYVFIILYCRLESVVYPLFTEPTHMVVFDIAFKRETYFDGSFGVLAKVLF